MNRTDAEKLFGLSGQYTIKDVRAAYKKLALQYHPDQNRDSQAANYFMQQINHAYEILQSCAQDQRGKNQSPQPNSSRQQSSSDNEKKKQDSYEQSATDDAEKARQRDEWARREKERKAKQKKAEEHKRDQRVKEEDYLSACKKAQKASDSHEHKIAAELFKKLGDYKDSATLYAYHENQANEKLQIEMRYNRFAGSAYLIASLTTLIACFLIIGIATLAIYFFLLLPTLIIPLWYVLKPDDGKGLAIIGIFFAAMIVIIGCFFWFSWGLELHNSFGFLFGLAQILGSLGCEVGCKNRFQKISKITLGLLSSAISIVAITACLILFL